MPAFPGGRKRKKRFSSEGRHRSPGRGYACGQNCSNSGKCWPENPKTDSETISSIVLCGLIFTILHMSEIAQGTGEHSCRSGRQD